MNSSILMMISVVSALLALACGTTQLGQSTSTAVELTTSGPSQTAIPSAPTVASMPTATPIPPPPTPSPVEGPGYGGHYLDREDKSVVHVYMVNPSREAAERMERTRFRSIVYDGPTKVGEVRPLQADYTFRQLQIWHDRLFSSGIWGIPGLTSSDVDERTNRVEFGVDCERNRNRAERDVYAIVSREDIPVKAIRVTVTGRAYPATMPIPFECAPSEVVDPLTGRSSPGFGGLYIDRDSRTILVYMLEPSQQKAEELAFEVVGREAMEENPNVLAMQGQYTWTKLLEWHDAIGKSNAKVRDVNLSPVYPDQERNRLVAWKDQQWSPDLEKEFQGLLDQLGVPRDAVVLRD